MSKDLCLNFSIIRLLVYECLTKKWVTLPAKYIIIVVHNNFNKSKASNLWDLNLTHKKLKLILEQEFA